MSMCRALLHKLSATSRLTTVYVQPEITTCLKGIYDVMLASIGNFNTVRTALSENTVKHRSTIHRVPYIGNYLPL